MKISVIIPTYNRFKYLLNAIESVKNQTYDNIEIIVVNDRSSERWYYEYNFHGINVVHLDKNAVERHGRPMPGGYPRSVGMKIATGDYIAFLDDDDIWLPKKLELQMEAMKQHGCEMSCTDGYREKGEYNADKKYPRFNVECYGESLKRRFKRKGKLHLIENGLPDVWNYELIKTWNCCASSSVIISKRVTDLTGQFKIMKKGEDWNYWQRALRHTDCVYVREPCFYIDCGHAGGRRY